MTRTLGKDLLDLESLTGDQIRLILDTAEPFKEISERAIKKVPALRGSTIVNLFFENSTRTRISFEFAEKRLSADTVNVSTARSYTVTFRLASPSGVTENASSISVVVASSRLKALTAARGSSAGTTATLPSRNAVPFGKCSWRKRPR